MLLAALTIATAITTDTVRLDTCLGTELMLQGTETAENYRWEHQGQRLDETGSVLFYTPTKAGQDTVVFSALNTQVDVINNLMANGDFETNPPQFTSDYNYAGWDPSQYYSSHGGAANLYTITHDASYFWKDFYAVKPHGGSYFALFDAGKSGYAWKASTNKNPNLQIEKDSTYLFSYWAAHPNKDKNSPAQLQFEVIYKDASGQSHTVNLGTPYTLGASSPLNGWVQQQVTWTAPASSSDVSIAVRDLNNNAGNGNDFCLDDIMFQKTSKRVEIIIHQTVFILTIRDCSEPEPEPEPEPDPPTPPEPCVGVELLSKWKDVMLVNNADSEYVSYQWYHDSIAMPGQTEQYLYQPQGFTGTYYCVMRTQSGGEAHSCPATFEELSRSAELNPGSSARRLVARREYWVGPYLKVVQEVYSDGGTHSWKEVVLP